MAVELRIAGPGLDVARILETGEAELVLGRDADCDICLPDPQRNVSRRHLAIWLEEAELKFRVLSVVNGVEMAFGEAPPGACGVLPLGQTLRLGDYSVFAAAVTEPAPPPPSGDRWEEFNREGSGAAAIAAPLSGALASGPSGESLPSATPEDDPFGEWGFETTFAPGAEGAGPQEVGGLGPGRVPSFFRGLGLDPASIGELSEGELEAMGRLVRILMHGVLELDASASVAKQEMRAEDRTMMAVKDKNPLKSAWPEQTKLRYMFGGRAAGAGFVNPERALRELLGELIAHNSASGAAARTVLESTLKEFAPTALKARLLGGGAKLFERTRAWDAYCKYYAREGQDMRKWTQRLLDRYFAEAYLRESLRIRRETPTRPK